MAGAGRSVTWLEGVDTEESVGLLSGLIGGSKERGESGDVADEALFWLAQSEDDRALDLISDILKR